MKKTTILAAILGVLILVSILQAVQLNGIKNVVTDGELTVKSAESKTSVSAQSSSTKKTSSVPKSIQNLPEMVGGC